MSNLSPQQLPGTWDLVSGPYTDNIAPVFERYADDALKIVSPGKRVLDVAAGPGTLSLVAAARGHDVTAIDFSPSMIERLNAEAKRRHCELKVSVGDGTDLKFTDGSFDDAFSMFGLIFFGDRAKGFSELKRVVHPGGRVLISSWAPFEKIPFFASFYGALMDMFPMPGGPPKPVLATREDCLREFKEAGFTDVQVHERTHAFEAVSFDAYWNWFPSACAPLSAMGKNLAEKYPAVLEELKKRIKAELGAGPIRVDMPALLTVGTKP
ncbi:MAG: class I SAM-dependent methyltransferase [Archangium sp.]